MEPKATAQIQDVVGFGGRNEDGTFAPGCAGGPGRPTKYTEELATEICARLANGESLRSICRDDGMPDERRVREWALNLQHPFAPQYARAREIAYHGMADDLLEIADDGANDWMLRNAGDNPGYDANGEHLQRSRLRVDTRKWMLSRMLPKIYGDLITQTLNAGEGWDKVLSSLTGSVFPGEDDRSNSSAD